MADNLALPSTVENEQKDSRVRAPELKRFSEQLPGYDCKHAPCLHDKKGNHGISGGSWIFAVSAGDRAVSLRVCTSFYPDTVPPAHRVSGWPRVKKSITGVLHVHRAAAGLGESCDFVDSGRCQGSDGSYLVCDQFASVLADTFEPQPEAFWAKLAEFLPTDETEEDAHG